MRKILGFIIWMLLFIPVFSPVGLAAGSHSQPNQMAVPYLFIDASERRNTLFQPDRKTVNLGEVLTQAQENLVPNPSFEEGSGNIPDGWDYDNRGDDEVVFKWVSDDGHSGKRSVGITNLQSIGYFYRYSWYTLDLIPVDPINNEYRNSLWYKFLGDVDNNDHKAMLGIRLYDVSERLLLRSGFIVSYSTEWSERNWYPFALINEYSPDLVDLTRYVRLGLIHVVPDAEEPDKTLELRFDDVFFGIEENLPPDKPKISGPHRGNINQEYTFEVVAMDPNDDKLRYVVDWGDGVNETYSIYSSGETAELSHVWNQEGNFVVKVKAIDYGNLESDWATFEVSMPKTRFYRYFLVAWLLDRPALHFL
jgi:hypothetical protein